MNFIKFISLILAFFLFSISSFGDINIATKENLQEEKELIEEGKLKGERTKEIQDLGWGDGGDHSALDFFSTSPRVILFAISTKLVKLRVVGFDFNKRPSYILFHSLKIHCC